MLGRGAIRGTLGGRETPGGLGWQEPWARQWASGDEAGEEFKGLSQEPGVSHWVGWGGFGWLRREATSSYFS